MHKNAVARKIYTHYLSSHAVVAIMCVLHEEVDILVILFRSRVELLLNDTKPSRPISQGLKFEFFWNENLHQLRVLWIICLRVLIK